ncbi:LAFE_0C02696g1_1 [Lachancea fermentati]|uniref:Spindle pole component BBP1 n=1 Tax=Lachancea fermentati TaxID=4955 RepID=A0A1G4M971_LACFM|nr:LAFE_0C02696g1_1 [Lachancea fermentati]
MLWSKQDTDDSTGGIYKWTMDALFGRKISPSRKYKEFAQDDTNYTIKNKTRQYRQWDGRIYEPHRRSNSFSFERDLFEKYELLPDEEEHDLLRPVRTSYPEEPVNALPKRSLYEKEDPTDTFSGRKQRVPSEKYQDPSLKPKIPAYDDPLVSQLFGKDKIENLPTFNSALPGKFPSPMKRAGTSNGGLPLAPAKDYTDEYIKLLDQLDLNGQNLKGLQRKLEDQRQQHIHQESSYREKYLSVRQELISELRQSKRIYDNYYKLYSKYKELKTAATDLDPLRSRIKELEAQVVDTSIGKATEVRRLNETIFDMEIKYQELQREREREKIQYESRIAELESLFQRPLASPRLPQSPFEDYNATVDRHFFKDPLRGL